MWSMPVWKSCLWSGMQRNGELPEEYTFDGIHLKAAGYAVWIEKIRPYVK